MPIFASQLVSALLLYLTFTAKTATMLVIYQTLAGLSLTYFFSTFWAIPMNTVPTKLMGVTSGFINMAGQIAAFISPIVVGYLVGATGGNYDLSFMFLIVSLLLSCAILFTLPSKLQHHQEEAVHG
jgi:MFS-type transporter involved in bile tolerance (Atg22 family)